VCHELWNTISEHNFVVYWYREVIRTYIILKMNKVKIRHTTPFFTLGNETLGRRWKTVTLWVYRQQIFTRWQVSIFCSIPCIKPLPFHFKWRLCRCGINTAVVNSLHATTFTCWSLNLDQNPLRFLIQWVASNKPWPILRWPTDFKYFRPLWNNHHR